MTREQAREAAAVMLGWADGREVEKKRRGTVEWLESDPLWDWASYTYRIKPTPVLRPWTADEVPLGAWVRPKKDMYYRSLITSTGTEISRKEWFNNNEHSTDGGLTWKPCGVEEVNP